MSHLDRQCSVCYAVAGQNCVNPKTGVPMKRQHKGRGSAAPNVHSQYQRFPLWLLEYANSSDYSEDGAVPKFKINGTKRVVPGYAQPGGMHFASTPTARVSEGMTGPFFMHAALYLRDLERTEIGRAVREFDDQLGERILNVDEESYTETIRQAKLFLSELLACLNTGAYLGNCVKELRPILQRIRAQQLKNIKDAYLKEDFDA